MSKKNNYSTSISTSTFNINWNSSLHGSRRYPIPCLKFEAFDWLWKFGIWLDQMEVTLTLWQRLNVNTLLHLSLTKWTFKFTSEHGCIFHSLVGVSVSQKAKKSVQWVQGVIEKCSKEVRKAVTCWIRNKDVTLMFPVTWKEKLDNHAKTGSEVICLSRHQTSQEFNKFFNCLTTANCPSGVL